MKTQELTTEEKAVIVGMHEAKMLGASIARNLDMPKTTIYTIIKNFKLRKLWNFLNYQADLKNLICVI